MQTDSTLHRMRQVAPFAERQRAWCIAAVLAVGVLLASLLTLQLGLPSADTATAPDEELWLDLLLVLRLPRLLLAIVAGAVLAVSGVVLQGLVRNPLAEPALIGLSGGAALGAAVAIALGTLWMMLPLTWLIPMCAFIGALGVGSLAFRLATRDGYTGVAELLLAGVAFNAICGALVGLLVYWAPDGELRAISFWLLGSLADVRWDELRLAMPLMLVALMVLLHCGQRLDYFALGERDALYAGVDVQATKRLLLLATAAGTGAAVAVAGIIGFVGLIVPHILRALIGSNHRRLLPVSALGGALVLVLADLGARLLMAPAELPIGLLTSFVGGPFFLFLLFRMMRQGTS